MSLRGILGPCKVFFCHTPCFTHRFVTHHLSHTTLSHTIFHTQLCHIHHFLCRTLSFTYHFVTHTQLFTYNFFNFSIFHRILCLSFLPRPLYNICCSSLLEEVDLWGYPVLKNLCFHTGFAARHGSMQLVDKMKTVEKNCRGEKHHIM